MRFVVGIVSVVAVCAVPYAAGVVLPKLSIQAEKSQQGFHSQMTVQFGGDRAVLVQNSNFLCGPSKVVELGMFSKADRSSARAYFEEIRARLANRNQAPAPQVGPHATHFKISQYDVSDETVTAQAVAAELKSACAALAKGEWTPQDNAVRVTVKPKAQLEIKKFEKGVWGTSPTLISFKTARCVPFGKGSLTCTIPDWGQAYLAP